VEKKFKIIDREIRFENQVLTNEQIVMLLNDGFEKTVELEKCYDEIKENIKLKLVLKQCYDYVLRQDETEEAILLRSELVDLL